MSEHFKELKKRIIKCLIFFSIIFFILFILSDTSYDIISIPLLKQLPQGGNIIATKMTTPFFVPLKLCFFLSILVSIPFFFYHFWQFIVPGMYVQEKKVILPLMLSSILFYYIGILFSFYIICPIAISFFSRCTPKSVLFMADISNYLDFIITTCIFTGFIFQIPTLTKFIIKFNIIQKDAFKKKRKYVILMAFIVGMLLAPPDVISQTLLALPMIFLFEIGLLIS